MGKANGADVPARLSRAYDKVLMSRGIVRALLCLLGIASIIWSFADPRFRDAEGVLRGTCCLPLAAGVALIILATAVGGRLQKAASWFALALVGQAVALQIIDAGPMIHYQHYKSFGRLFGENPLILIFLLVQTAFVLAGLRRHGAKIHAWIGRTFKVWQLIGIALVFCLSAAAVSREITFYAKELVLALFVQAVNLANIVLVAAAIPEASVAWLKLRFGKLFGQTANKDGREPGRVDRFAAIAALWVIVLAAVLSVFSYERHPHVPDEVAYLYHARYLASGMLTLPAPAVRAAFDVYLMDYVGDRWYAVPPFGWPAVLAIGALLGVPWLVNPVLAGLNVLLAYALARELFDRGIARWVVLLLCISPWNVLMAMNFMTHTVTLTCALGAALGVIFARKTGKARWALIAGGLIGMASLVRPLEGLVLAGLFGLWSIGVGGRRLKLSSVMALILGAVAVGALVLPYNKLLTGKSTAHPLMVYTDKHFGAGTNALGFGPKIGLGWELDPYPGHGPVDAAVNANLNTFSLNIELLGWSIGSLLPIAILLFSGSLQRSDYLMLAAIAAIFGAHIFYWYSGGPDFGARYWFLMLFPCLALTARGIQVLKEAVKSGSSSLNHVRVTIAVLALCALTLVNYLPWRAFDKYHHYLGMRPDVRYLAKEFGFGKSLVLIRGNAHPDYVSAFIYNPLDFQENSPVYAWDRDPAVTSEVLQAYQDRPVWIVNGPSITGRGYEIVSGPVPVRNLLTAGKGPQ